MKRQSLRGEADVLKREIPRNQSAPARGAKLIGGFHGYRERLARRRERSVFPVEGVFLDGVNVADKQNAEERDHRADRTSWSIPGPTH